MRRIWRISSFAHGSLRDSYERTLANAQRRFLSPGYFVGEKRERLYVVAGGIVWNLGRLGAHCVANDEDLAFAQ